MTILYDDAGTLYDADIPYEGGASTTQYLFTPPLVADRPTYDEDSTPLQKSLWLHFENRLRGVNVWQMSDGTFRQDTATTENSNTDLSGVYPWNPSNPGGPYVTSVYILPGANPQIPSVQTVSHSVYPVAFFAGASTYPITQAQYELLVNYTAFGTGYLDCITPV